MLGWAGSPLKGDVKGRMVSESSYTKSASLAFEVAKKRRIKKLRAKGRQFTRRGKLQWINRQARKDTAGVLLSALREIEKILGRPGASWTPSDKAYAQKWVPRFLLGDLYEANRGRGRPKRGPGLIGSVPAKRGRRPLIPAARAQWWCRFVLLVKMGRYARIEGYRDTAHLEQQIFCGNVSMAEIDRGIPTALALRLVADLVTSKTGAPPDKSELAYVSDNYDRLRRRFPFQF